MATIAAELHAHEVIEMMRESHRLHTRESLEAAILARFGRDARFSTCSGAEFNALQLVEFLATHGKIVRFAGGFIVNPERTCSHASPSAARVDSIPRQSVRVPDLLRVGG